MPANTETNTLRGPLLEGNQGNRNPNEDGVLLSQVCACCQVGCGTVLVFFVTWVFVAYDYQQRQMEGGNRRLTENDNIDSLPLLSISLLGLAAMIASTMTKSIQNYLPAWPFNGQTSKIEVSNDIEQGLTPSTH